MTLTALRRSLPYPLRRALLIVLVVLAAWCLYQGVTQPIIRLTQFYVFSNEHSLSSAVYALYLDAEYFLAGVVLLFSITLPTIKLAYLFVLSLLPLRHLHQRHGTLRMVEHVGKWSMHDVLILAITIVYLKSTGLSEAVSMSGTRYFAAAVILIMIAYGWVKETAQDARLALLDEQVDDGGSVVERSETPNGAAPPTKQAGQPGHGRRVVADLQLSQFRQFLVISVTFAAVVTLVLGVTAPTIKLTKFFVFSDEHSILAAIWALYEGGEPFLAALIFVFSIVFPAIKLFYLIVVSTLAAGDPGHRQIVLNRLEWLGKWSMMDVLVLALLVFYVNASTLADATALRGIYFFTTSVFLTMVAYALVKGAMVERPVSEAAGAGGAIAAPVRASHGNTGNRGRSGNGRVSTPEMHDGAGAANAGATPDRRLEHISHPQVGGHMNRAVD